MTLEDRSFGARVAQAKREIRARSFDGIERRTVRVAPLEVRAVDGEPEFTGHAYVFNDLSEDLGYFEEWYERIAPGAGAKVLGSNPDIRALFNHDPNLPLARTTIKEGVGRLLVAEDEIGLRYEFDPTETSYAADLRRNVAAGVVNQSSFAFRVGKQEWLEEKQDDGSLLVIRTILEFSELYDVSPVTYPAYPTTDVGLAGRSELEHECAACRAFRDPSPDAERVTDGPAGARGDDGGEQERQTEKPAGMSREALDRRMRGLQAAGIAPEDA